MMKFQLTAGFVFAALASLTASAPSQCYNYKNVRIGGGGGFVPGIVFNTGKKGLAYARTDIGGAYKLKTDGSHEWEILPVLDAVNGTNWGDWYIDSIATDPVEVSRLYLFAGAYTNGWDPNNASILASTDYGRTFIKVKLPFKGGGNMPGRGMGERLAIDPNMNRVLYLGTRSGNGLYKSTDYGATWSKVTSFPNPGTWRVNPADTVGLDGDIIGIVWVTFDSTSGTPGNGSKRIFVGVAEKGAETIYVTENGGSTWSKLAGQPIGYIPHRGVFSPKEKVLYVTYTDGAGPYDGSAGYIQKYNLTDKSWMDISPVRDSFGYGGITIDPQRPGTLMVATLNQWWPDANLWRSTDSGKTWRGVWEWAPWPQKLFFNYDVSRAPWLYDPNSGEEFRKLVGWMIESLTIDPFDSNHFLYGTGATIMGSQNALNWDSTNVNNRNITLESLATGVEETSIQALLAPPVGPPLISAVGDITGFVHNNLDVSPTIYFKNPVWSTTRDLDYAGNVPTKIVRIGTDGSGSTKQVAISTDSGVTWAEHPGAPTGTNNGAIALGANGTSYLWRTGSGSVLVSTSDSAIFIASSGVPSGAIIAADRRADKTFYAASGNTFYVSTDGGVSFTKKSTFTPSTSSSAYEIVAHPSKPSDVWVSTTSGLFHSTNGGSTWTSISAVSRGYAFSLGAPKTTSGYPAIYLVGVVDGIQGVYKSDDVGVSWVKINDATKWGGGAPDSIPVSADLRQYGRVFLGTNGRGIFQATPC